jgi:hypothetical protein
VKIHGAAGNQRNHWMFVHELLSFKTAMESFINERFFSLFSRNPLESLGQPLASHVQ